MRRVSFAMLSTKRELARKPRFSTGYRHRTHSSPLHQSVHSSTTLCLRVRLKRKVLVRDVLLLERGIAASLLVAGDVSVLQSVAVEVLLAEAGKILAGSNVADLLGVSLREDEVDFLEGATGGFGVEEVDDGDEDCVKSTEEEVGAPADLVDENGRDHDDEEVPEPVLDGGGSVGLSAGLERVDFSRVQPGEREPGSAEEGDVEEQTEGGTGGGTSLLGRNKTGEGDDHGNHLAQCADEEELAATKTLN